MARVVVFSYGYLGDVAPYVPIANRLAERGHDVTFLAPAGFRQLLQGERFSYATYPLDASPSAMHADPLHQRLMEHPVRNVARLGRYWMRAGFGADPAAARASLLATLDGADALVTHPSWAGTVWPVAASLDVPMVVGQLFPMLIPTEARPPPLGRRLPNFGRLGNRLMWRALAWLNHLAFDKELAALSRSLDVEPVRSAALVAWMKAARIVMLVSPHYFGPAAPDFPAMTWGGFSVWDGPSAQPVDPVVEAFLADGSAPVLLSLGTAAATGAGEYFASIARDLDAIGLRSLILVGDAANLEPLQHRDGVFVFAPVNRIIARCRVALISGALGGLAAALTAGVPVVVFPLFYDQYWNGRRVEELGVGVLVRRPEDVAPAVARIEGDPRYRERAAALAAAMVDEDGPGAVADAVESLLP